MFFDKDTKAIQLRRLAFSKNCAGVIGTSTGENKTNKAEPQPMT